MFKIEYVKEYSNQGIVKGLKCGMCGSVVKIGQHVLYERRKDIGYSVFHTDCMKLALQDVPTDNTIAGNLVDIKENPNSLLEFEGV